MSERDSTMDALDQRLLAYLDGRAEMAAAFGPGPDQVVASIAAGTGRAALPGRRARTGSGVPALAWALLLVGLLAALALAITAGGDRRDGLVIIPPSSVPESSEPESIDGVWWLDFAASAIDDAYGGGPPRADGLRVVSGVSFGPDGAFRVSTGAGGGCDATGRWELLEVAGLVAVEVPTGPDSCEERGPGPAAREIRQRLARTAGYVLVGSSLTLVDGAGGPLLVFDRSTNGLLWRPIPPAYEGAWQLDFDASGIEGSYTLTSLPKRPKVEVGSWIELADGTVRGGTGAGGGCDSFEGTYAPVDSGMTLDVPAVDGHCGGGPVYPDLEVRKRLARTAAWEVDGEELRLRDTDGALLLVYRRRATETP